MRKLLSIMTISVLALVSSSCVRDRYNDPGPIYPQQYTYIEEFDNNSNRWAFSDVTNFAEGVVSGGFFYFDYNDDLSEAYYVSKDIGFNRYNDFTIYTRIGTNKNAGLLFGYNSATNSFGYSFTIDKDGYYALYDEGGNGYGPNIQELVAPATNNNVALNGGLNTIRLEQQGNRWIGYVNDLRVFNIEAQNLKGTNVGFVNLPFTQTDIDYLQVDWLE